MGHYNPAFSQKIFNIAEAQRETVVEPHGVNDNLGWKAETWVAECRSCRPFATLDDLNAS